MISRFLTAAACAAALVGSTGAAMAATPASDLNMDSASRFSGPGVYTGAPALPVALSMVIAGGGPADFSTLTLVHTLAGDKTAAEVASLKAKFGAEKVTNFVKVFNFVVSDTLDIVKDKNITLPSTPSPDPKNGPALAAALYNAGETPKGFNVEVMLDRAVSHGIHAQVMTDIDKKFGVAADADYHIVLTQAMKDLATVYHLM